jgi:hypothetical protein
MKDADDSIFSAVEETLMNREVVASFYWSATIRPLFAENGWWLISLQDGRPWDHIAGREEVPHVSLSWAGTLVRRGGG